jgi:tRNA(fMet)-specific endonuclease VapC
LVGIYGIRSGGFEWIYVLGGGFAYRGWWLLMPVYMLDRKTSVAIVKRTDKAVMKRLNTVPVSDVCISTVTHSELVFGVGMSLRETQDQAMLDLFLKHVAVLEYPVAAALHYGEIRQAFQLRGETIGANDLLIAAHARCLGLTLVTDKVKKLGRAPGLGVECWAA